MPSRTWRLRPDVAPEPGIIAAVGGQTLLARLLTQRGITSPSDALAFLDPANYTPAQPEELPGLCEAAETLRAAIDGGRQLLVWGDFDVDGQTSTTLLVTVLTLLAGSEHVRYHIPLRSDGHGIRVEQLKEVLAAHPADLLITCDTGIAEDEAIVYARRAGLDVVVTDHHELPAALQSVHASGGALWGVPLEDLAGSDELPGVCVANAVVDPHFLPEGHPLAALPGVGVAWLLASDLLRLNGRGHEATPLLELVALGIVADVARQVDDTRYLLQVGLEELRRTARPGLRALMEFARVDPRTATAESIGFQIGPRLNAVGRLDDPRLAVQLLTTTDETEARTLAAHVDRLNRERRLLTSEAVAEALERIDQQPHLLDSEVLILESPSWQQGIIGIVAGRLTEEFHKPTLVIRTPPGETARGSARSTPGVHIGAAIAACSDLLVSHGGHAGAAGFSVLPQNLNAFRRQLEQEIGRHRMTGSEADEALTLDAELPLAQTTLDVAEEVASLAPFGLGNPAPLFLSTALEVTVDRRFGQEGTHRRLVVRDGQGDKATVTWFNGADAELPVGAIDLAYTLSVNQFRETRSPQLQLVAIRATPKAAARDETAERSGLISVIDLRQHEAPRTVIPTGARWYAEGTRDKENGQEVFAPRHALAEATGGDLVLWTAPPSAAVLARILQTAQPNTLYVVGAPTTVERAEQVIEATAAMCKYAIKRGLPAEIGRMAARIGVTEAMVRTALLILTEGDAIRIQKWLEGDGVRIVAGERQSAGPLPASDRARELAAILREQTAETRAYRRFFRTARADLLGFPTSVQPT